MTGKAHTVKAKVFCIGFQKTGTTSLHAALTMLGLKTAAVIGRDLTAAELRARGLALCLETARDFDAVQDMPWPLFFRELDQAFPGSKFILTIRDAERWFASIEAHFGAAPDAMGAFIYGDDAATPVGNKTRYLETYTAHNAAVRAFFADRREDLLVMDLAAGDAWPELCDFLAMPVPGAPFPAKNRQADRRSLLYRVRRKLSLWRGRRLRPEQI